MLNRNLFIALTVASLSLGAPRTASADFITINFSGQAHYYDYLDPSNPGNQPLPFQLALTALGVVQGTSPLLVSLTFDSAAQDDGAGKYSGALIGGHANLGPGLDYRIGPADVNISPFSELRTTFSAVDGPTVHTLGQDLLPVWAQLGFPFFGQLTSASLSDVLRDPMSWPTLGFSLSFDISQQHFSQGNIVYSGLQVTSVKVPEPAAIVIGSVGLIAGLVRLRRKQPEHV